MTLLMRDQENVEKGRAYKVFCRMCIRLYLRIIYTWLCYEYYCNLMDYESKGWKQ